MYRAGRAAAVRSRQAGGRVLVVIGRDRLLCRRTFLQRVGVAQQKSWYCRAALSSLRTHARVDRPADAASNGGRVVDTSGVIDSSDERVEERLSAPAGQRDAGRHRLRSSPRPATVRSALGCMCVSARGHGSAGHGSLSTGLGGRIGSKEAGAVA